MGKARAIIGRRKSIQNIRKITRTMELIATARYKKALDRATQAEAFTRKIAEIVADLGDSAEGVSHPLLEVRDPVKKTLILVLTSNRGLAGGYNGNVQRLAARSVDELIAASGGFGLEVAGKRGINYIRYRGIPAEATYNQFDDRPQFHEVEALADRYIAKFTAREIDRLIVVYTKFKSTARQEAVAETLLPMVAADVGKLEVRHPAAKGDRPAAPAAKPSERVPYEFLPDAKSILEEIVPVSFKVRLFKCFLDAAVSEQTARMVAMRNATDSADRMIKRLTTLYNRARQAQITSELAEIISGASALD